MAGDPPLRQVVTRTWEGGARGAHGGINWSIGAFRATNRDDLLFVMSDQSGFGYFRNFGETRRQGLEIGANGRLGRINLGAGYTFLSATVHPLAGFLAGWTSLLAGFTAPIAAAALALEAYLGEGLGLALPAQEPQVDWQTSRPEDQGFSPAKLEAFRDALTRQKTQALIVLCNDRLVLEWYADGRKPADKHYTASLAKAIVGGLSVAVALDDERLTLDDPVAKFVPQWQGDAQKSRITIRPSMDGSMWQMT